MPKEEMLPLLATGDALLVKKADLLEKKTEPPKRYGQGKLIQLMEDLGLGTKATRHEALAKLYSRGFIEGNPPQPTATGISLIDALKAHASAITSNAMTSQLEKDMDAIASSQMKKDDVCGSPGKCWTRCSTSWRHTAMRSAHVAPGFGCRQPDRAVPAVRSPLVVRKRKSDDNKFIACSGFPACRNTFNVPPGSLRFDKKICEKHSYTH